MKKTILLLGVLSVLALMIIPVSFNFSSGNFIFAQPAAPEAPAAPAALPAPAPLDPVVVLRGLITLARNLLTLVAVLFILLGAFLFITAEGDDKKIDKGRKTIMYALVAVAVAVMAHGLVIWVQDWAARPPVTTLPIATAQK